MNGPWVNRFTNPVKLENAVANVWIFYITIQLLAACHSNHRRLFLAHCTQMGVAVFDEKECMICSCLLVCWSAEGLSGEKLENLKLAELDCQPRNVLGHHCMVQSCPRSKRRNDFDIDEYPQLRPF